MATVVYNQVADFELEIMKDGMGISVNEVEVEDAIGGTGEEVNWRINDAMSQSSEEVTRRFVIFDCRRNKCNERRSSLSYNSRL